MLAGLAAALAASGRRPPGCLAFAAGAARPPQAADRAPALMRLLVRAGAALRAAAPPRDLEARIAAAGRPAGLRRA